MPDPKAAARAEIAVKMMLAECEGQPYDVRRRFLVVIPVLRGHKMSAAGIRDVDYGTIGQCDICEQVVKVRVDGTSVEGRAVENDCPAAVWRQP
jgi:hypothetical protein